MRVLFDGYWWHEGPPSGRNVLRSLVDAWGEAWPHDELVLAAPKTIPSTRVETRKVRLRPHGLSNAMELASLSHGFDAVLCQNFAPSRRCKATVGVFVHDAMFRRSPEFFTWMERAYLAPLIPLASKADVIFTSSATEAAHIRRCAEVIKSGVSVKPVGLGPSMALLNATPERPEMELERFLLLVGRLNIRKNVEFAIEALLGSGQASNARPLVVVGPRDGMAPKTKILDKAIKSGAVIFTGHVSDSELRWYYENSDALILPSLDEGFGMPLLEAAALGRPVACSNLSVFHEVVGENAEYFDPRRSSDLVRAIAAIDSSSKAVTAIRRIDSWLDVARRIRQTFTSEGEL